MTLKLIFFILHFPRARKTILVAMQLSTKFCCLHVNDFFVDLLQFWNQCLSTIYPIPEVNFEEKKGRRWVILSYIYHVNCLKFSTSTKNAIMIQLDQFCGRLKSHVLLQCIALLLLLFRLWIFFYFQLIWHSFEKRRRKIRRIRSFQKWRSLDLTALLLTI